MEHHLKEGDIFLLKKGETVEYYPSFSNPWTYYWLGVGGKQIINYLNRCQIVDNYVIVNEDTSDIKTIIQNVCELSKSVDTQNGSDILIIQNLYHSFISYRHYFQKHFQPK